jgi:WD40 repeat protein
VAGNQAAGKEVHSLKFQGAIRSLIFSPDGKLLAIAVVPQKAADVDKAEIVLWSLADKKEKRRLPVGNPFLEGLAFSPDGTRLAVGSRGIEIWDLDKGQSELRIPIETGVGSLAFAPDGKTLASGLHDTTARVWDVETGKELHSFKVSKVESTAKVHVAFTADGSRLAAGSAAEDGHVQFWNVSNWKEVPPAKTARGDNIGFGIKALQFLPDGKKVVMAVGDQLATLDLGKKKEVSLIGRVINFQDMALSSDGTLLATAGSLKREKGVQLWQVNQKAVIELFDKDRSYQSLAFTPDGKVLAAGTPGGTVTLWDVARYLGKKSKK